MNIRELLKRHEGVKLKPYVCSAGKLTIGVGRNLEDVGISEYEANLLLDHDIERITKQAIDAFHWFTDISRVRKDVVLSMIFNVGLQGFLGFKKTILAIAVNDFELASKEMMDSKWAAQVGGRAYELSEMMRTGEYLKGGDSNG